MRIRRAIARAAGPLRALDRRLARLGGRRTILFEARTPMNLAVLRPVFEPLLEDTRLRILFTGAQREDLSRAFASLGLTPRVVTRRRARWIHVDLYVNADPWEAVSLRRVERRLNFFHGVAGKYNLDCPDTLPLGLDRYDCIAFPNEDRLGRYVAAGLVPRDRAALVGFPKADALTDPPADRRRLAAALDLDAARPTVIYAPTFSPASSLHEAGDAIVQALLDAGCNVIVKLHDRSLDPDPRYNGGVDWRERFSHHPRSRFLLAATGDSTPFVVASDVMVTDHSTIGFEFCVLNRPVIVFDASRLIEAARINPEKVALLRSAATVVADPASLAAAVTDALSEPGRKSTERRKVASEVFYRPGGATERALRLVYELLDLSPFEQTVVSRDARAWSAAK